jgi:hypothetical protein
VRLDISYVKNAENDARVIMKLLEGKYGFNDVVSLFNDGATYSEIRKIFVDTLRDESRFGSGDRLIIYYSGHG